MGLFMNQAANSVTAAKPPKPRLGIQVIARAAKILRSLEDEPQGLSLAEIAARVDMARSTVQRIVTSLAYEQLLIAATPKSRVKLGPALIRLAKATNNDIDKMARPYMDALSRKLNETIDLSVMQGKAAVFIDQILGLHRLRAISAIGESFPLHCTACGKALLATLSDEKLDRHLDQELEFFTSNTKTDPAQLRAEILRIRKDGIAYDIEEHTEGICAMSTVFTDPLGRAFAVSIPVPTTRFTRNRQMFEAELLKCRMQIIGSLGDT